MSTRTQALAFKAELIRRLRERAPGLTGVQVHWSSPPAEREVAGGDAIYLGRVAQTSEPATNISSDETVLMDALVSVMGTFGDDAEALAERAFQILGELEDLLAEDPRLDCTVSQDAEIVGWVLEEPANAEAGWREAAITARIEFVNRITP